MTKKIILNHLMTVSLYIINIIIILKIFTLSYNLGEGNIRCNKLITNMGWGIFAVRNFIFFNYYYYYLWLSKKGTNNLLNRTILFLVTFISFLFVAGKKKRNRTKEKKNTPLLGQEPSLMAIGLSASRTRYRSNTLGDYNYR